MDRKIRVGAVSYLNTKPLIFGIEQGMIKDEADLIIDYPAKIAAMLLNDEIDLGLVPVAILPKMKEYHIISDYCIGAEGEVASVCLFSEVPLDKIERVLLDYHSRTSVALLKILIRDYWKIKPEIINTSSDYRQEIKGTTAGLVIGDRALEQRKVSKYIFDLALAWEEWTGLPFVFAAWISNKKLDKEFIEKFNAANKKGLDNIPTVIAQNPYSHYDLDVYYNKNIRFMMDDRKKQALDKFVGLVNVGI